VGIADLAGSFGVHQHDAVGVKEAGWSSARLTSGIERPPWRFRRWAGGLPPRGAVVISVLDTSPGAGRRSGRPALLPPAD
jgi:hypothetical protein